MADSPMNKPGTVYLVGAGPGDPGLITVRGMQCLQMADVVVYDRLVDERLLARAREDAELIDVGKTPSERRNPQADTNALLAARAREGKCVVRLKGGDPFVFGRGGEEAEALAEAGIPFEVVPGVTSAIAAPAYAGIPLTRREFASSLTIVTGSESPDKSDSAVDWDRLAQLGGTLVVLMGWENLASIAATLVRAGRPPDTPVALIEWGSEPYQQTLVGTLSDISRKAKRAGLAPPIVTVIGEVVRLREKLRWFDNRPLFGKRVLVTRTPSQAGALSDLLSREGARPLEVPTIDIQPLEDYGELDAAVMALPQYDWVVFTSVNPVEAIFERLASMGQDARAFYSTRAAAIGPATRDALQARGIIADFVPEQSVSESVAEGLKPRIAPGERVLLPRSNIGRESVQQVLEAHGATVDTVTAYNTVTPKDSGKRLAETLSGGIDIATFTSSSTVKNLASLLGGDLTRLEHVTIACIGPVTAAAAQEAGLKVAIVAREHTITGLVEAIKAQLIKEGPSSE